MIYCLVLKRQALSRNLDVLGRRTAMVLMVAEKSKLDELGLCVMVAFPWKCTKAFPAEGTGVQPNTWMIHYLQIGFWTQVNRMFSAQAKTGLMASFVCVSLESLHMSFLSLLILLGAGLLEHLRKCMGGKLWDPPCLLTFLIISVGGNSFFFRWWGCCFQLYCLQVRSHSALDSLYVTYSPLPLVL